MKKQSTKTGKPVKLTPEQKTIDTGLDVVEYSKNTGDFLYPFRLEDDKAKSKGKTLQETIKELLTLIHGEAVPEHIRALAAKADRIYGELTIFELQSEKPNANRAAQLGIILGGLLERIRLRGGEKYAMSGRKSHAAALRPRGPIPGSAVWLLKEYLPGFRKYKTTKAVWFALAGKLTGTRWRGRTPSEKAIKRGVARLKRGH